jgi:RimK family alpha-L-glutamate ligase
VSSTPIHGWILYSQPAALLTDKHYEMQRFIEAAPALNIKLHIIKPETVSWVIDTNGPLQLFINGEPQQIPHFVIPRQGYNTTYAALALLNTLRDHDVFLCNDAQTIQAARDKCYMHQQFVKHGLPTPKTMLAPYPINYEQVERDIGFPLILKALNGSQGRGVMLCETATALQDMLEFIYSYDRKATTLLQSYVAESRGRDLRVLVLGGKVLGVIERSSTTEFKANFSRGGNVAPYAIDAEIERLALMATQVSGLHMAGVDLLFTHTGYTLCEINSAPGFQGFEKAMGGSIAHEILKYCVSHVSIMGIPSKYIAIKQKTTTT